MKRFVRNIAVIMALFIISAQFAAMAAETTQSSKVKQAVASYFNLRYIILSKLNYDVRIKAFMFPEILNTKEAFTEADVLDILVQYRKNQPNDMRFSRTKYTLAYGNIKVNNNRAWVILTDSFEYYYNCTPTVKTSGSVRHLIQLGMDKGNWLIISDSYTDPDGIGMKLGQYFLKSTMPLKDVKKAVLLDLQKQSDNKINKLFTKADFPRIDGSTATYPLSIEMSKALLGLDDTGAKGFIVHNTTHNAYVNLINGKADLILVTPPSEEEKELARKAGIELEIVPVCKEGFVFLVNKDNPVNNLSSKQIRDIYQGKIKNWKEAGGEDSIIIPYQRELNSGSQTLMESIVMKGLPLLQAPKETIIMGRGELIDKVADYSNAKNALGYSVYYYATTMYANRAVKLLSIDSIQPGRETIKDATYPFIVAYYAIIRKSEAAGSSSRKLLKWLLSAEGQGIVNNAGFVPVK
jgi:phosphate transport system substrate-binding protein